MSSTQTGEHVRQGVPLAAFASYMLDPRAGAAMNSGRRLSGSERLRLWLPLLGFFPALTQAVSAARGETESEYAFRQRLAPLSAEANVGLAEYLRRKELIGDGQLHAFLGRAVAASPWPAAPVSAAVLLPDRVPALPHPGALLTACWDDPAGCPPVVVQGLLERRLVSREEVRQGLRQRFAATSEERWRSRDIRVAQNVGLLSEQVANRVLTLRFWSLYDWAICDLEMSLDLQRQPVAGVPERLALERALVLAQLETLRAHAPVAAGHAPAARE